MVRLMGNKNSGRMMNMLCLEEILEKLAKPNGAGWYEHTMRKNEKGPPSENAVVED